MPANEQDIGAMFGSRDTGTFFGLPPCADIGVLDADIAILGIAGATPYRSVGAYCTKAPSAIRAETARYSATVSHHDFELGGPLLGSGEGAAKAVDCGDLPFDESDAAGNRDRIRLAISTVLDRGTTPIVVGGDDSVPIPMFQAFEGRGRFTILQLDAHIDFRDEVDGERWGLSSTMRRASELACVERIVQVGQRGVGSARPADYEAALAKGVSFVPASALHANGIGQVLDLVPRGAEVLIAFDCDVLDPSIMPAVIGRSPGGLGYWQALGLIQGVAERARIAAFNLVEFMPARDVDGLGALVAGRTLAQVVGLVARHRISRRS